MSKYVVVDMEMCNVPKGLREKNPKCKRELIQLGAVMLDESYQIVDSFVSYVSPEYGSIDAVIRNITGITNAQTRKAPHVKEVLESFAEWLPEDAIMVSWSENDKNHMRSETKAKNIEIPEIEATFEGWIDSQRLFGEKMNSKKTYNLTEALTISNISYENGAHDALVDAHNTALLFSKMMREPEFEPSCYYLSEDEVTISTYNPFAELFATYGIAV